MAVGIWREGLLLISGQTIIRSDVGRARAVARSVKGEDSRVEKWECCAGLCFGVNHHVVILYLAKVLTRSR